MDKRINEGIVSVRERRAQMTENNIHILESVKDILTIANTDLITVQMGADYFQVGLSTFEMVISNNRKELEENGYKTYKLKELKNMFENPSDLGIETFPNRGKALLTKRTLLNIGMLLRDSEIAKELRRRMLDVMHDAENGQGDIDTISNEIDEETRLKVDYVDAMMSGNLVKMNEINAKLFELKNKRILELENENKHKSSVIEGLAENITLAEKRQRLNQINELYELSVKLFEIDLDKLLDNIKNVVK